jgi:hypothetical protein
MAAWNAEKLGEVINALDELWGGTLESGLGCIVGALHLDRMAFGLLNQKQVENSPSTFKRF